MTRHLILPSPALSPLVQACWLLEEDHVQAEQHVFLPGQLAHLTFYAGRGWMLGGSGPLTPVPEVTLEGLFTAPAQFIARGRVRALRVELYPWAARQLFDWTYPDPALDLLAGTAGQGAAGAARAIRAALAARDDDAALGLLERWLLALASNRAWTAGAGVQAAARLYHSGGRGRVAELAGDLDVSARTLERQFMREVGITAKTLARLIRFETAHRTLTVEPRTPLAALASDLGFFDQMHLTREFRALGGVTPGTFARLSAAQRREGKRLDVERLNPRVLVPQLPE